MPDMTKPEITRAVLHRVGELFDTYVVFPSPEARDAVVLWTMHAWIYKAFEATPRLSVRSTEPGSGKSRVLDIVENLVPKPMNAVNLTPAVMWRLMDQGNPTLMLDECDTIFGQRGSSSAHMQLRGIINAGHRRNGTVPRTVGREDVKPFSVFGVVAMAGIGRLPETIATRSVEIVMRKRKQGDHAVKPLRMRFAQDSFDSVRKLLEGWSSFAVKDLEAAMPELPVEDRKADVWEPLVAVADYAGDAWPERARQACVKLTTESAGKPTSLGVQLLADIKTVFDDRDQMFTFELVSALHGLECTWGPDNLDGQRMARVLDAYQIQPRMLRRGDKVSRGYTAEMFAESFERYLPTPETELVS